MAEIDWSAEDMRDVFFDRVYELACEDERIVFLSVDHGAFSLEKFKRNQHGTGSKHHVLRFATVAENF